MDSDGETEAIPSEVIEKCFFISDGESDECTPEEEILLYFYPDSFPLRKQVLLAGAVVSLAQYISDFTKEPIRTMSMSRVKFAVIQKGKYTLAASGPAEEADSVLQNHVETLYAAYSFYWGPIEEVGERFSQSSRLEFVHSIQQQCRTLVPLLDGFRDKGKLNAFVWLPFSSPPPNTARHFMQASNILSSIQTEDDVFGGCMFFESSVLCTHIDAEITRWVLNLADLIRQNKLSGPTVAGWTTHPPGSSFLQAAFVSVYLTEEQSQRLGLEERHISLCVSYLEKISLALLMTKGVGIRNWHDISLKRHLETRLSTLEKDMLSSYSKGSRITGTAGLPRGDTAEDMRTTSHSLTTDSLTGMTKGSILKLNNEMLSEREDRFLVGSSYVHEVFYNDQDINKAMLADHSGLFYGRHMFSKEVFYQRFYSSFDQTLSLEHLEELAQQKVREEYNINLI